MVKASDCNTICSSNSGYKPWLAADKQHLFLSSCSAARPPVCLARSPCSHVPDCLLVYLCFRCVPVFCLSVYMSVCLPACLPIYLIITHRLECLTPEISPNCIIYPSIFTSDSCLTCNR